MRNTHCITAHGYFHDRSQGNSLKTGNRKRYLGVLDENIIR